MFENLNNEVLLANLKKLVGEEKCIHVLILDHLREVEARRLFALRGYSSLYEFCQKELGLSDAESYTRIAAMRSIRDLPLAREKLVDGSVSLSTLSQLYTFTRNEEKIIKSKLDLSQRTQLLEKIENKSQKECEREFVKLRPEIIAKKQTTRAVSESLTEIKFIASTDLMDLLTELRDLLGNRDIDGHAGLILEIAKIARAKLRKEKLNLKDVSSNGMSSDEMNSDEMRSKELSSKELSSKDVSSKPITAKDLDVTVTLPRKVKKRSRYIAVKTTRAVWDRDEWRCCYVDPVTGRRCESRHALQQDHIIAFAHRGTSSVQNLRLLCRTHNQVAAIDSFSRAKMMRFIPSLR